MDVQQREFAAECILAGELLIGISFKLDQEAPNRRDRRTQIQTRGAKRWIGLAERVANRLQVRHQVGQNLFR